MLTSNLTMLKGLLFGLLLATFAAASETDGGHAPPRRWTHARGPASGSARSLARAPRTFGGVLWTYKARDVIAAPPVTWDGVAFVVDGKSLVALDTGTGKLLARTRVDTASPRPACWDDAVFLREGSRLVQYRRQGRRLVRRWSFDGGPGAGHPRVLDGEIYLPTKKGLLRLRAGSKRPAWTTSGKYRGEPAIYRDHVYALRNVGETLQLVMHRRTDGVAVAECDVGSAARTGGRVVVADGIAAVLLPPHERQIWSLVQIDGKTLKPARKKTLLTEPMGGKNMLLALSDKSVWTIIRLKKDVPLVSKKRRPDLVVGAPSGVFLNKIVCFGTWAANVNANRILWHVNERKDTTEFKNGLHFAAVPAGHELLLMVPRGAKSLCAVGPEEIG